jgi:hypothetical protein
MHKVNKLALVEVAGVGPLQPIIMHEKAAARYIGMNRTDFREKVLKTGLVPFSYHAGGKTRIYFKEDLDLYAAGLRRDRMRPARDLAAGADSQ